MPLSVCLVILVAVLGGCRGDTDPYAGIIEFKDDVTSNSEVTGADFAALKFQDLAGNDFKLDKYRDTKNLVLVITRGYVGSADPENEGRGSFCTYCSTQTARLIANYDKFTSRDAEVLLVFPVVRREDVKQVDAFVQTAHDYTTELSPNVPFPLIVDFELESVNQLGIRDDLSKPATYILDKHGDIRFAYVGATLSDRPSVKAMLSQLDMINRD